MSLVLPKYVVSGTPEQMGEQYGSQLQGRIRAFVPMRFEALSGYAAEAGTGDLAAVIAVGRASYPFFERYDPEGFREHEATARAAGVDPVELFTAGNMTDLRDAVILHGPPPRAPAPASPVGAGDAEGHGGAGQADAEGCSSVLIPPGLTADGRQIAGQTWDLNPEDVEYVVAVNRRPAGGPATWSVTVAGCPTLVGMNEHGLAVGTTNIKTWGSGAGVGYLNILHRAVRCRTVEEAIAVVRDAPRAGAHTYWFADGRRAVELETSPAEIVVREATAAAVVRTNHCLAPAIAPLEWQAPSSSSLTRLRRLSGLLAAPGQTVATLRAAFGDRSDGVDSVSRYAEDGQGTATNSVVIAVPAECRLHACRGPADRGEWTTLSF